MTCNTTSALTWAKQVIGKTCPNQSALAPIWLSPNCILPIGLYGKQTPNLFIFIFLVQGGDWESATSRETVNENYF